MGSNNTSTNFMTKLSRYVGNVTGSIAYWQKQRKGIQVNKLTAKEPQPAFLPSYEKTCTGQNCIHCFLINHMMTPTMKGNKM